MKLINGANFFFLVFSVGIIFSSFSIKSVAVELNSKALFNHRFPAFNPSLAQQSACLLCFESKQSLALKTEILTHRQLVNDEPKTPADVGGSR